jgi:hypothetical protein
MLKQILSSGGHSTVAPPGPIPNPEVKRCSANGSVVKGYVRVGRCQVISKTGPEMGRFFAFIRESATAMRGNSTQLGDNGASLPFLGSCNW